MPPFFDHVQLHQALSSQAVPVLEAMATNDNLRSLHRFERDDPPPYASSTESEMLDEAELIIRPPGVCQLPQDLQAVMEPPINDDERHLIADMLCWLAHPSKIYYREAKFEDHRFDDHSAVCFGPRPPMFRHQSGLRRRGVIARHLVKKRWEKLGIWNRDWGFAGRNVQPGDNSRRWTWWWQPGEAATDDLNRVHNDKCELVPRALRLRQNLRRGEHAPVLPRSHPRPDTTATEAETFLISRPWFIFEIEVAEEMTRYLRLDSKDQRRYPHSARAQVVEWWKQRGDLRDEFNNRRTTFWKWRHESPSPEPEDLTPVVNMKDSPLDVAAEMEFTPSEIDDFETIDLPTSEQPEGFWITQDGDLPPYFPGQMPDEETRRLKATREIQERLKAEGCEPPVSPGTKFFRENFPGPLFGGSPGEHENAAVGEQENAVMGEHENAAMGEHEQAFPEPQEGVCEPQQAAPCSRPQKQPRLRQRQPRDGVDGTQDQDQALQPPPRRSARIAGMKRTAEPLPSPPQKRRRLRQRQPRDGVDGTQDQDQPLPPPRRRSARIANAKRIAEPLPSQTERNKRRRGRAASQAGEPATAPTSRATRRTKTGPLPARDPPKKGRRRLGQGKDGGL